MNTLTNPLIEETKVLVQSIKRNYLAISANLYRIHEGWTGSVDGWVQFYTEELELSKSQVSKMLKVGGFILAHGLLKTTDVSYEKLYLSINRNPDKDPKYVVAEAQSWSADDYKQDKKEDGHTHEYESFCKHCWKHE